MFMIVERIYEMVEIIRAGCVGSMDDRDGKNRGRLGV
jgi:hypothetical protein